MMPKVSLRLKLSDFINTDIEQEVIKKINNVHNELHITVLLYLWFEEDEINSKDLKEFLMKWEDTLSFKTVVKSGHDISFSEFIWFDIVPANIPTSSRNRFRYQYVSYNKILDGLQEFYNVTKFTTSEKPTKRQKRNDYED
jgi:hypothetical protein